MLKNILNLEGVTLLSKEAQKSINGGIGCQSNCTSNAQCTAKGSTCSPFDCDGTTIYQCYSKNPSLGF
jgi:hypothetical protein